MKIENFEYIVENNTVTITKYTGNEENVIVPKTIDGFAVDKIGNEAFSDCDFIQSITLSDGITLIGDEAFLCCYSLQNIILPESLKEIGMCAFSCCSSLDNIKIPDSVTVIGIRAFEDCTCLHSIIIPDGVTVINSETFSGCENLRNIKLPNNLKLFDLEAINNCDSLDFNEFDNAYYLGNDTNPYLVLFKVKDTDIDSCDIHADTKIICSVAFEYCSLLNNIVLPAGLQTIGCQAFYECESPKNITIPNSVTIVERNAFESCFELTINCEADSEPEGWEYNWNVYEQPVNWGVKKQTD